MESVHHLQPQSRSWTSAGQAKCVYNYKPATLKELPNVANILPTEALVWQSNSHLHVSVNLFCCLFFENLTISAGNSCELNTAKRSVVRVTKISKHI